MRLSRKLLPNGVLSDAAFFSPHLLLAQLRVLHQFRFTRRVVKRGYGSGAWGWEVAYKTGISV
jgi:hypothetical protein